jgi:two-component system response regulator EvgA
MSIKVLVVDEHPVIRLALRTWLAERGFEVVAETGDGKEAMQFIHRYEPQIIMLEPDTPTLSGFTIMERIRLLELPIKVVVFSAQNSSFFINNCVDSGAHAFVSKTQTKDALFAALRAVSAGRRSFPDGVRLPTGSEKSDDPIRNLTGREQQVLHLLTQGLRNNQIAKRMQLSDKTISTYKARLLQKLNAPNVLELILRVK